MNGGFSSRLHRHTRDPRPRRCQQPYRLFDAPCLAAIQASSQEVFGRPLIVDGMLMFSRLPRAEIARLEPTTISLPQDQMP